MKNIILSFLVYITFNSKAQVTYEASYVHPNSNSFWLVKNTTATSTKYIMVDPSNSKIYIFNQNHTLDKMVNIAPQTGIYGTNWFFPNNDFFSEQLFNTDNLFEYPVGTIYSSGLYTLKIYNENSNIVFQEDSIQGGGIAVNTAAGAKLILYRVSSSMQPMTSVYSLGGSVNKVSEISNLTNSFSLFPNPTNGQFKLNYNLPEGITQANLEIYDTNGKLIRSLKVSHILNDVILDASEFPSGTYTINIITDSQVISTRLIKL